jgi:hypothetical protein
MSSPDKYNIIMTHEEGIEEDLEKINQDVMEKG